MFYFWRTIYKGVRLIKKGMIWRIGDEVDAWTETWELPDYLLLLEGKNLISKVKDCPKLYFSA
jgi:hypothetical protein